MFQTVLPTVGPGALKAREDPNQRASKVCSAKSLLAMLLYQIGRRDFLFPTLTRNRRDGLFHLCFVNGTY